MQENFSDYISVKEAASILGVSARHVYNLIYRERLPYIRPNGGNLSLRRQDVDQLKRPGPGRRRKTTPQWYRPSAQNKVYVTTITTAISSPEQEESLKKCIFSWCKGNQHDAPGTAIRHVAIIDDNDNGRLLEITLIYRQFIMPSEEELQKSWNDILATLGLAGSDGVRIRRGTVIAITH